MKLGADVQLAVSTLVNNLSNDIIILECLSDKKKQKDEMELCMQYVCRPQMDCG